MARLIRAVIGVFVVQAVPLGFGHLVCESIRTVLRNYAEFAGRAGRPEFWWWSLFNLLVLAALNVLNAVPVGTDAYLGTILAGLWSIGVLLPGLAVTVRRLRDAGHAWQHLFWFLVPIAGAIVLITYLAQPTKEGDGVAG